MDSRVVVHPHAAAFLERAGAWLMGHEDEHNLVLGLADSLSDGPPAPGAAGYVFGTVEAEGDVVGCFFRTPPYKAGLTRMPLAEAGAVAQALRQRYEDIPAFFGPQDVTTAVAEAWVGLAGGVARIGLPQRMYRLDAVVHPALASGALRRATMEDLPLVAVWGRGFTEDAGAGFHTTPETHKRWVDGGDLHLWEDDGRPVAMTVTAGRTPNGVRIGYVYTPRDARRRGYASTLVAEVSQRELDHGARFCVLYTDLTNPTSNAMYARLGYRPLMDLVDVDITPG